MNPDAREILEWLVGAFDAGHLTIRPEASNGFIGRARFLLARDSMWEDITARQAADTIFQSLMNPHYIAESRHPIDPKWAKERANNIAQGLLFHRIK